MESRQRFSREVVGTGARLDLNDFRYLGQTLDNFDIGIAWNHKREPYAIIPGPFLEVEARCRDRAFLKDAIDRGESLIQIRNHERVAVGHASLKTVLRIRQ